MGPKEVGYEGIDWIELARDGVQWRGIVKSLKKTFDSVCKRWGISRQLSDNRAGFRGVTWRSPRDLFQNRTKMHRLY
jgi:hypothetical protein